jgi:TRAP-type C4-dicarboxylate transport system permease small subunit
MHQRIKLGAILKNIDLFISGIALIVLIITTFLGVIMRYFLNDPFVWQQELQLMCFVWVVFFAGGAAFRTGSHVAIEFIVERLAPSLKHVAELFGFVVILVVLSYFFKHSMTLVNQMIVTERTTNILNMPYAVIYAAFPISCILMIVNYAVMTVQSFMNRKKDMAGVE